ncbi:unnamed protein product [Cylindrotheca closterium]|uniref:Uncharacterized protein n=1 Tax=Cylindrotheca closterium TaxID=2856 RepID=A0AAD2G205_9STRA|nr:unnamed protein product [Cylindrotheca closterium]
MAPNQSQERKAAAAAIFLLLFLAIRKSITALTMLHGSSSSLSSLAFSVAHEHHPNERIKNADDMRIWEIIWRDATIPSIKTTDVPMKERERTWKQLSDQTPIVSMKHVQDLFAAFPIPRDAIQHYNQDAFHGLISSLIQAQRDGRNFTIVANGGSATAGGGNPSTPEEHRYYPSFSRYLNALLVPAHFVKDGGKPPTVQWVNQGHGFRTSLHTAIFFDSFIPSDTDLLIWEFSINDPSIGLRDQDLILRSARDSLLSWLYQVKRMKNPPKVILIYKWDPPFHRDNATQKIVSRAFDAHGTMARQFPFVIGHIHLADYIGELQIPNCEKWNQCPILSDHCHISKIGHMATAFLLLNFLNPNKASEFLSPTADVTIDDANYEWSCGVETEAKRILKEVTTTPSKEWRPPIGTWTADLPLHTHGRLVEGPRMGNPHLIGAEDPMRIDRQQAISIYMCDNDNEKGSFSVVVTPPLEPLRNARVVLFTFRNQDLMDSDSFQVRLNGSTEKAKGELVPVRVKRNLDIQEEWRCHFSCPWSYSADVYVYVFHEPQATVHSMELCTPTIPIPKPKVQSVVFW